MHDSICLDSSSLINSGKKVAFGEYTCTCKKGFTGFNCATDTNECESSPCANGGLCLESGTKTGLSSGLSIKLSSSYVASLGKKDKDGKITAQELGKDPEGAALIASLRNQIASNLGLDSSHIYIQNIATGVGRRALQESLVDEDTFAIDSTQIPTMQREGYYTVPSFHELDAMPAENLLAVKNFRVGRVGYGEVRWLGETDVTGINLDEVVNIKRGEVSIYKGMPKPPIDTKLNKAAVVVLEKVLAPTGVRAERFGDELKKALLKAGAMPIDYQLTNGRWSFGVPNFME